jgi:Cu+-exporting ATPase
MPDRHPHQPDGGDPLDLPILNVLTPSPGQIDPVCGMTVNSERSAGTVLHDGVTYHFCSSRCRQRFEASPAAFLDPAHHKSMDEPPVPGAKYTCPMDPEIVQDGPGICPKCGMALEPMEVSAEEQEDPELTDMRRRFWIALALTAPVFAIAMGSMLPIASLRHVLHEWMPLLNWVQLALATPVVAWCGAPFFERGWRSIVNRSPNMFTLIAIGVGAAYLYSLAATIAPHLFPDGFRSAGGAVEPYFDSAAVIITLVLVGQMLELRARSQTRNAVRSLLQLAPKTARRVKDGRDEDIPIESVRVGDHLRVRPGERVPADGTVLEGTSAVDESMMTGEPIPVTKSSSERVIGGTINGTGSLLVRTERVGAESLLSQIVRRVSEAQRSRAPIEKFVNKAAAVFVPIVIAIAACTLVATAVWGAEPRLAHALLRSVAVLIIACPCALGLATPMAIMVGTGQAAASGVLFRDAEALERLREIDTIILDKTGTLTEGRPKVTHLSSVPPFSESEVLQLAAGIEQGSEHPLASAVVSAAKDRELAPAAATDVRSITGKGLEGTIEGRTVLVGKPEFLSKRGVDLAAVQEAFASRQDTGETLIVVAVDSRIAGWLGAADPIKESTPHAIERLKSEGLRIVMATGDHEGAASRVAQAVGISEFHAGVLPQEKDELVAQLQRQGRKVAVAGDGINDAPALARADVGIAMGTGTDVAIESAGVTLVKGDLRGVLRAIQISRATSSAIRQNLALAMLYNAVCIPAAALGWVTPIWASAAMSLSSVSVIANSLRLRSQTSTRTP